MISARLRVIQPSPSPRAARAASCSDAIAASAGSAPIVAAAAAPSPAAAAAAPTAPYAAVSPIAEGSASAASSAAENSAAEAKRLAGSFARALSTTASSAGVTLEFSWDGGRGCSETCFSAIVDGAVAVERNLAGERLVEDHPDRVEVGRGADVEALRLLRREVVRGPEDRPGLRDLRGARPGDAEVGHPGAPLRRRP